MQLRDKLLRQSFYLPAAFFTVWFVLVFFFWVKDYGVPYDELAQRGLGGIHGKYILSIVKPDYIESHPELKHLPDLATYRDRTYGVAYELPTAILEKALGFTEDQPQLFWFRHRLKFLLFFLAMLMMYQMACTAFRSWKWALLTVALAVISPRIFADSIYNSKDGVFISAWVFCTWALWRFLNRKTFANAAILAALSAFAMNIRIIAFFFPLIAAGMMVHERFIQRKDDTPMLRWAGLILMVFAGTFVFLVLTWPYLWANPVGNFLHAIESMTFYYGYDGTLPFFGTLIRARGVPWYYLPGWIAISIPLLVLSAFLAGEAMMILRTLRMRLQLYSGESGRADFIHFLLFTGMFLIPVVKPTVLYNGWRHFYFIWPSLVWVAVIGLKGVYEQIRKSMQAKAKPVMTVIMGLHFAAIGGGMVLNHPYECMYFNPLAGSKEFVQKSFELDYWGISYPEAMRWLTANAKGDSIVVNQASYPGRINWVMVDPKEAKRFHSTPDDNAAGIPGAQYLVGYTDEILTVRTKLLHEIRAYGLLISTVRKVEADSLTP